MRILFLVLLLAACTTQPTAPGVVDRAVAEPPCDPGKLPRRPFLPADNLTGKEDIFTIGTTLWADRKTRQAYEAPLAKFAEECARKP